MREAVPGDEVDYHLAVDTNTQLRAKVSAVTRALGERLADKLKARGNLAMHVLLVGHDSSIFVPPREPSATHLSPISSRGQRVTFFTHRLNDKNFGRISQNRCSALENGETIYITSS